VIVFFDVFAGRLFLFMRIGCVNLSQGFVVFVLVLVLVLLFLVVLFFVKLAFFDFGFSCGFKLFVVFLFVLVFVEFGTTNLRNGFNAVLRFFVLSLDKRRG